MGHGVVQIAPLFGGGIVPRDERRAGKQPCAIDGERLAAGCQVFADERIEFSDDEPRCIGCDVGIFVCQDAAAPEEKLFDDVSLRLRYRDRT